MRAVRSHARPLRRALPLAGIVLVTLLALTLAGGSRSLGTAAGQVGGGEPTPQTDASVPARAVMMLGSSPGEAPGETWGIGELGGRPEQPNWVIVRYAEGAGWSLAPTPLDSAGHALSGFEPDRSVIGGQITRAGSGALLGKVRGEEEGGKTPPEVLLTRDPGGTFTETQAVPVEMLEPGDRLFSESRAPLLAALDEAGGHAGAFVVPVQSGVEGPEDRVLHWDGTHWASEAIEGLPVPSTGFRVLAIGASSTSNAWLLAQLSSGSRAVALYSRRAGGEGEAATWRPVALTPGQSTAEPQTLKIPVAGEPTEQPFTVAGTGEPPSNKAQLLTVTQEGVWIDGERGDTPAPATMFFKPRNLESGEVLSSWCNVTSGTQGCDHTLPDALPTGPARSFAWADPSNPQGFGQRVITGLLEGVSLRLEGASFTRVLALGGWKPDVGGSLGAAFSEPFDGWLGNEQLPVHLTLHPQPSQLTPYPVPFRHALTAIAPQPSAPVGALSSEALAVGDEGEVARYVPNEGWMPESLLGAGGRRATPRLRAVAWPIANRAYAVGEAGQMWMWSRETGFWEQDPATPVSFTGDLLGVAFDPNNPSRGYAVGQAGVLLAYGKSWSQEPLPAEVAGASFTSIAFAGSEAIVAYRIPHFQTLGEGAHYTGGLLVNDGSGWRVDAEANTALGGAIPWAVAGLADGGAAISAEDLGSRPLILERNVADAPWQPTAVPYSGIEVPSSLALFREGGALRVVGAGNAPKTLQLDTSERQPPAGFPPNLVRPYPLSSGYVLRQTSAGWSDETHERNNAQDPPGEYKLYDMVYQPDPTAALLVDPSSGAGWAVGGTVNTADGGALETADIARYREATPPAGFAPAPVQAAAGRAVFAIGGNAMCVATCADRANARIGPDVWLTSALEHAREVAGVRAFLDTGPRVTTGAGHGEFPVSYEHEFVRGAALLDAGSLPVYAAASSTDRGPGSECGFLQAFSGFPTPFGGGGEASGLASGGRSSEPCSAEGQSAYYSLRSSGSAGPVRVLVLDTSTDPNAAQLEWLTAQLTSAKELAEPAIAVGNADINAEIATGDSAAGTLAQILVGGGASAYFYDAPEENVSLPLRVGGSSIPTFGSGTLGYVTAVSAAKQDFHGHSGFLLAEVNVAGRDPNTNRAPVTVQLVPVVGQLAMEAKDGVLLRRSHPALFAGLARRPFAGGQSARELDENQSYLYTPIPANCVGAKCAQGIFPQYTFTSSRPDIGDFVEPNLASADPHAVLLGPEEKPVADPTSGLFCAYNAGTTVVTISAGGLSASLNVTVQAGSVRRPCGTTRLKEIPVKTKVTIPSLEPTASPAGSAPPLALVPVPPLPAPAPPAHPVPAPPAPFLLPAPVSASLLPFVPLPVPTPARPTPPSGTSAVTSPVEAPEKQEEKEEATESVSNQAVAYRASEYEPTPAYILGVVLLAAFAGASIRRRPRARRRPSVAPATVTTMASQRRMSRGRRSW